MCLHSHQCLLLRGDGSRSTAESDTGVSDLILGPYRGLQPVPEHARRLTRYRFRALILLVKLNVIGIIFMSFSPRGMVL